MREKKKKWGRQQVITTVANASQTKRESLDDEGPAPAQDKPRSCAVPTPAGGETMEALGYLCHVMPGAKATATHSLVAIAGCLYNPCFLIECCWEDLYNACSYVGPGLALVRCYLGILAWLTGVGVSMGSPGIYWPLGNFSGYRNLYFARGCSVCFRINICPPLQAPRICRSPLQLQILLLSSARTPCYHPQDQQRSRSPP